MAKVCLLNIILWTLLTFSGLSGNTTDHYSIEYFPNFKSVSPWFIHDECNEEYRGQYNIYKFEWASGTRYPYIVHHRKWLSEMEHNDSKLKASWSHYSAAGIYYLHLFDTADEQQISWKFVRFLNTRENKKEIIYQISTDKHLLPDPTLSNSWGLTLSYNQLVDSKIVHALYQDKNCIQQLQKQLEIQSLEELRINEELADITVERDELRLELDNLTEIIQTLQNDHIQELQKQQIHFAESRALTQSTNMQVSPELLVENYRIDNNNEELSFLSVILSYGLVAGVTAMIMCVIFYIVYSYQKRRWKALKLRDLVQVNIKQNVAPVLVDRQIKNNNVKVNNIKKNKKVRIHQKWNPESFNQLVRNSVGVQDALMDDVVKNMETEGSDVKNVNEKSKINEGNETKLNQTL